VVNPRNQIRPTRTQKRRLRRKAVKAARQQEIQETLNWGGNLADWPIEEFQNNHCDTCHFNHLGTYHWCKVIPGLDSITCPICSRWDNDPILEHPLLYIHSCWFGQFIEPHLKTFIGIVRDFDYQPFIVKLLVYWIVLTTTIIQVR
jgi:hypothetical protein